ncbi:MAG: aminotransferase class V-fold PLP-dependent enzyme, partial [archaeon]|nr:aminotransferase class V-fold PLP-dependent enzyme [archaeon]
MNLEKIRQDFPVLSRKINGKPLIYFDNAATSLKPKIVIDAMNEYYSNYSANVHRGIHKMSEEASEKFEESHEKTAKFIGAKKEEVSFTKNTTESINSIMYSLLWNGNLDNGKIVLTEAEHHANLVPWQQVAKKNKLKIEFAKIKENFELDLQDLKNKIDKNTKVVAVAHAFNTIASINPVKEIAKIAHENNALFLVDGAQSVPHKKINVKDIGADFFAFSSHKMLGPTGLGVLFGKEELMKSLPPFLFGGSMIHSVSLT